MKDIFVIENPTGTYSCDLDVTVEEWKKLLSDQSITTQNYKNAIMAFYNEPGHHSTCRFLGQKYHGNKNDAQKYNSWITKYGEAVTNKLNRFQLLNKHGKKCYWNVAINPGTELENGLFDWTLRKELVDAIESLGWNNHYTWIPFYTELADKVATYNHRRDELIEIVNGLDDQYIGYVKNHGVTPISYFDPFSLFAIFNRGNSDKSRKEILAYFKRKLDIKSELPSDYDGVPIVNAMYSYFMNKTTGEYCDELWELFCNIVDGKNIQQSFDNLIGKDGIRWNITMFMFWIRPNDYISLDTRNRNYLPTININFPTNFDKLTWDSYYACLTEIKNKINNNTIIEKSIPEISYNAFTNNNGKKYWLVGHSYAGAESQLEIFVNDSIWEARFLDNHASDQNLLKLAKKIKVGDVLILKSSSTKGQKHDKPFLRVKAVGIVVGDLETRKTDKDTIVKCKVRYTKVEDRDFDGKVYGSYRKTIHEADAKVNDIIEYANETENDMPIKTNKHQYYIDLLESNKNIVLTGAPGTGKTYLAREIAKEMDAETMFVQFHPSYDYTDFVEGLRPVDNENGQISFERKDGVFKEFCKNAIKNLEDSKKSVEDLEKEQSWQNKFENFVNAAIDNHIEFKLSNGSVFKITDNKVGSIIATNDQNEKTKNITVNSNDILELLKKDVKLNNVKDIRNHFNRKFSTQPDSYSFVITNEIRKQKDESYNVDVEKVKQKKFVCIIDEINRGEASKIFGELFYAIDPGYRGDTSAMVKTQYQNLVSESDCYNKGFYVPDNIYIIGTMNDIDRSVESMDFAMRRRFTWIEIKPEDRIDMLDEKLGSMANSAKDTMRRLNEKISETEELGSAYMIGPAYFLKLADYKGDFEKLWKMNLEPLLKEYLRGISKSDKYLKIFEDAYYKKGSYVGDIGDGSGVVYDEN